MAGLTGVVKSRYEAKNTLTGSWTRHVTPDVGWMVVQSKPAQEAYAAKNAARQGYRPYFPRFVDDRGRLKPLFPRYFFVEAVEQWWPLKNTYGVSGVVTRGDGYPALVRDREVAALRKREVVEGGVPVIRLPIKPQFEAGDRLRIRDPWHVLAGRELLYLGMKGADRVRVLALWFGIEQEVALETRLVVAA